MSGAALFVYGTLQFPDVLVALLGRGLAGRPAWLPDHARLCVRGEVYPGAVPRAGASTPGLLYEHVDVATLERLDRFEGAFYERRRVTVRAERPSARKVAAPRAPVQASTRSPATRGSVAGGLAERIEAFAWIVARRSRPHLVEAPWDEQRFVHLHLPAYVARCRVRRP